MGAIILFSVLVAAVVGFFALQIWARTAPRPELGTEAGKLHPCPESPNCVSSRAQDDVHAVEPLPLPAMPDETASSEAVGSRHVTEELKATVRSMPRSRVVEERPGYLAVEFRSRIFGFVDDVEVLVDAEAGRVDVRSASRLGYSDMDANRKRVEELRRLWLERIGR
jgi:uncharacterized protein (DUF1499 family)